MYLEHETNNFYLTICRIFYDNYCQIILILLFLMCIKVYSFAKVHFKNKYTERYYYLLDYTVFGVENYSQKVTFETQV